jgi:indole-3-glycerol phosphate synthase
MILDDLVAGARAALAARRARRPLAALLAEAEALPPPPDFAAALGGPGVAVIAEVKRASPSRGPLNLALEPADLAVRYAAAGAAAVSVLTEEGRFRGSLADLAGAHEGLAAAGREVPLLCKDFIVDPYQVVEARAAGAAAVLLIVAALEDGALEGLYAAARGLGLAALVEAHDEREVERAAALEGAVIGINNRDLRDFTVDLAVTERLLPRVPAGRIVVSESGVRGPADVRRLAGAGVSAVLVGEALVTAGDLAALLGALVEAGR